MRLSFVIPACNERETLRDLVEGIVAEAGSELAEIVVVDDGSTDGSYEVLSETEKEQSLLRVIRFETNRGKTAALVAGLNAVNGDVVFTMDADLQDDPAEIPRFLEKLDEGHDVVCGWKAYRRDPWHKTIPSRFYNGVVTKLFGLDIHDINCGFKAMTRAAAASLELYGDRHRLIPVLAAQRGFNIEEIPVQHHPRRYGSSKYGIERFTKGGADVMSLWFISRYKESPGHFFFKWATVCGGLAVFTFLVAILAFYLASVPDEATEFYNVAGLLLIGLGAAFAASATALFVGGLVAELIVAHALTSGASTPDRDGPGDGP